MCGISCSYKCKQHQDKRLLNRGPDHQQHVQLKDGQLALSAFVLHVQGESICSQPCSRGNKYLVYNGQLLSQQKSHVSDTQTLLEALIHEGVVNTVQDFHGPCAAIYYDSDQDCIWFWRDYFGRRSLLITQLDKGFLLSSVADKKIGTWYEVPSCGVFCYKCSVETLVMHPYDDPLTRTRAAEFGEKFEHFRISETVLQPPVSQINKSVSDIPKMNWECVVDKFIDLMFQSVQRRECCCSTPLIWCKEHVDTERHCYCAKKSDDTDTVHTDKCSVCQLMSGELVASGARIGVLFSGGIDCTLLAFLLHRTVPSGEPIDLINVSFGSYHTTPDRLSALASLRDLQETCPGRIWNLIQVNITLPELQAARARHITGLIYPHSTVLDDSIGCALWFAARGLGLCRDTPMYSTARLLFSGIGADELLGGYSRHRGVWQNGGGLEGVLQEMQLDINRISERNLGRDNRVIGDHRRDCVAPYLDINFVSYLNSLPIQYKVDYTLPRGQGEKLILRKAAQQLGLTSCSTLPKRAIQFGSKIAKLEKRKEKGSEVCSRLTGAT